MGRLRDAALGLTITTLAAAGPAAGQSLATWESSIAVLQTPDGSGQTIRQFARVSVGGPQIRIRFSNETGTARLLIADAHVALPDASPGSVETATDRAVTFNGSTTAAVPPGAVAISDAIDMPVQPLTRLAVSAFFRAPGSIQVGHLVASETNYLAPGDHAAEATMTGAAPTSSGFWLGGISVAVGYEPVGVVACLGDSITDGLYATSDAEHRWPDRLAERLLAATSNRVGAINAGLTGNGLLGGTLQSLGGTSALARLTRDVLSRPGVHWLVLFEGINDIFYPPDAGDTAAELIAAYGQVIAQAHDANVKVFGATLTPFAGTGPGYYSPAREAIRQRVNAWIRTSGAFDAVFDFDAVVRAPGNPPRLQSAYDGGDHLHLSDAGYAALATSIPLSVILRGGS